MFIGADQPLGPGTVKQTILYTDSSAVVVCWCFSDPWNVLGGDFTLELEWMHDSRILTSCRNSCSRASNEHLFVLSTKLRYERCSQPAHKKLSSFHINSSLLPFFKLIIPWKRSGDHFNITSSSYIFQLSMTEVISCWVKQRLVALLGRLLQPKWHLHKVSYGKKRHQCNSCSLNRIIFWGIICGKAALNIPHCYSLTKASCSSPEFHKAQL